MCLRHCRVPKQEEKLDYKYVDVVRKKAERDKLDAYVCIECDQVSDNTRIIQLRKN